MVTTHIPKTSGHFIRCSPVPLSSPSRRDPSYNGSYFCRNQRLKNCYYSPPFDPRIYFLFALVPLVGMIVLVGPSLERHPITQRATFMFVDEHSELESSEEALQATLKINRSLPPTHPTFHRVLNVAGNFIRLIGPVRNWELFVVDDPFTVNTFVLPAGKILFSRG
ncbi:hypothetical protein BJ742DRAFT_772257 [Cladochytrium replicatum]|nr:hypothetical protein BJ742DRAFT_772257 [Cladochytrium replicatum]